MKNEYPKNLTQVLSHDEMAYLRDAITVLRLNSDYSDPAIVPFLAMKKVAENDESMIIEAFFDLEEAKKGMQRGHNLLAGLCDRYNRAIYLSERCFPHADKYASPIILYNAIHEYRHVWQEKNDSDYLKSDAFGMSTILDPSEIDADGFALAFMEMQTAFGEDEYLSDNINRFMELDGGKRKDRKEAIIEQYFN